MPVHLYGHPFDLDPILAICRKHKLPLVEDTANRTARNTRAKPLARSAKFPASAFIRAKTSVPAAKAARC